MEPELADGRRGLGTEGRMWVLRGQEPPSSISTPRYEVTIEPFLVPMRDGTDLLGVAFLPNMSDAERPGPGVLVANGYSPPAVTALYELIDGVTGAADAERSAGVSSLARRGYAVVHVWMRSAGIPDGEGLYYRYAEDGYDAVEWLAQQEWCDGNVGMVGHSLYAISQWVTAKAGPPSLRAIVPKAGCGDCYWYLWYPGGTLPGPGREQRRYPHTPYDEYAAARRHRDDDDWWRQRDTNPADHQDMAGRVAVLNVGGWDDYIHAGGIRAVEELVAAGGSGMQLIGPWNHVDIGAGPGLLPYDLDTFTTLWFDRFLKGIDNGIDDYGALIYVEGAGEYRIEAEWPIPDAHSMRLYLRAERSGSGVSINDGMLSGRRPDRHEMSVQYRHHPDGPHNDAGGGSVRPQRDQRVDETHGLTWTTGELQAPIEVTGWPRLTLWATSSAPDTDFVAEITDVASDGTSTQVGRGWLNAPRSFSRTGPQPLDPGTVYRFTLELWPLSYVFRRGHRIRVSLAGSDSGGELQAGPFATLPGVGVNPNPATVAVCQDARYPSHLELPVIGTGWRQLAGDGPEDPDADVHGSGVDVFSQRR